MSIVLALLPLIGAPVAPQQSLPLGRLAHNRTCKEFVMGLPSEEQADAMVDLGMRGDHPHEEEVALYVAAPLDATALAEFEALGITVDVDVFVPAPSAGHALGYYLAMVPHDQLETLVADPRVAGLRSVETRFDMASDTSREFVGIDRIRAGECVFPRDGAGVRLAIIDSGIDLSLGDFPVPVEAYDVSDGPSIFQWGTEIGGPLAGHGTHVAGVAVGSGSLSNGQYAGGAPGVDLLAYKTWNDVDGFNYEADLIRAIERAVEQEADIINLSLAAGTTFLDGSAPLCQAVDWASSEGALVVVAAGNEGASVGHTMFTLAPGETSPAFSYDVVNFFPFEYTGTQRLQVIWRDEVVGDENIRLICVDGATESCPVEDFSEVSDRGTEARSYSFSATIGPGGTQSFPLQVVNDAVDGESVTVHVYRYGGLGRFDNATSESTVLAPGIADSALCVGAWVSRTEYTDAFGNLRPVGAGQFDELAAFSSRGPRIDGVQKPDLCAPGTAVISLRASEATVPDASLVDDDGLLGEGGVNHMVRTGTSFAAPMVAAGAAILMEAAPYLDAAEIRDLLRRNASQGETPDMASGYGLMDVHASLVEVTGSNCSLMTPSIGALDYLEGGEVQLRIDAEIDNAFDTYLILGSFTGTEPGMFIDPVSILPLNYDAYLRFTYLHPNAEPLLEGFGTLDEEGCAEATFVLEPGAFWLMPGMIVHHSVLVLRQIPEGSWVQFSDPAVCTEIR